MLSGLEPGITYHYRVISKDSDGATATSIDYTFSPPPTPNDEHSSNAYPNPCDFSNGKTVKFVTGKTGSKIEEVSIYTLSGKLVRKLTGTTWDGTNDNGEKVARGIYLYKITEANGNTTTGKLGIKR